MSDAILPLHVGFIVDGNRRWAKERGLSPHEGHVAGYTQLKEVLLELVKYGVRYASVYAFSTENWQRSEEEVDHLMGLLLKALNNDIGLFLENDIRIRILGRRDRLSKKVIAAIDKAESATRHLKSGQVLLCLNYGGQQEVVDAVQRCVAEGITDINEETIAARLYAPDVPPCDMIVRTSGEQRLSNFMLWRSAYSELLFIKKNWPEMTKDDVPVILNEYTRRSRRFGG